MASDSDRPKSSGRSTGSRRKRPVEPRPLELEAREVKDEDAAGTPEPPAKGEAPAGEEEATAERSAQAAPDDGDGPQADAASQEPERERAAGEAGSGHTGHEDAPAAPPAGAPKAGLRPGTVRLAAAGFAGGLVALFVMLALGLAGIWPRADDPQLRTELAAAQARIAALEAAEIEVPPAADPEAVAAHAARLDTLEARLDALPAAPEFGPIEERLAALEAAAVAPALPEDVEQRLSALEGSVEQFAAALANLAEEGPPDPQIAEQLARIEGELAARLAQIEARVSEQAAQVETALAAERGARQALGERMDRLQSAVAESEAAADRRIVRAAAGAMALAELSRAVAAGQPYERHLAAIRPLVDDAGIATLSAHAASGLPSPAELADGFADRATAILAAGEEPTEPSGVMERMTAGLRSLVRVRPAGPMEGDSRAAIVSRIEAALAAGELAEAQREWQGLDTPARRASADWAEALATRVAAEDELAALAAETTAALGALLDDAD